MRDVFPCPSANRFRADQLTNAAKSPLSVIQCNNRDIIDNNRWFAIRTSAYPCELTLVAAWARYNANRLCRRSPRRRGKRCHRDAELLPSSRQPPMLVRSDTRPRLVLEELHRSPAIPNNPPTNPVASSTPRSKHGNSYYENQVFYYLLFYYLLHYYYSTIDVFLIFI